MTAVLVFLDAWTRQLDAKSYVSGVYSSEDAAIVDLQTTSRINGHKLAKPQCVWIALSDHRKNMSDPRTRSLCLPSDERPSSTRTALVKFGGSS